MDEKLTAILKKAGEMFMQYGLRNVSMDDICRELGISKKTLYKYVDNKADLIEQLMNYNADRFSCDPHFFDGKKFNAIDILFEVSQIISENIKNTKAHLKFELQKYYTDIYKKYQTIKNEQIFEAIIHNIEQGIKEGIYREDLNIEVVAKLYMKKLEDIHDSDLFESINISFEQIFEIMFENHIRGISNKKGVAYMEERKKKLNF